MARKVKAKAKAKASVRVNVNVNSRNKRTVLRRREFPAQLPQYLPPVRVEVHGTTQPLPPTWSQPLPRDAPQPIGININNTSHSSGAETKSHAVQTPPVEPTVQETPSKSERVEKVARTIKNGASKIGDKALTASTGALALGYPATSAVLGGVGFVAKGAAKAADLTESGAGLADVGSKAYEAVSGVASKAKGAYQGAKDYFYPSNGDVASGSADFLDARNKEQLREFIVANGGNLDGFNARTTKPELLARAKQVFRNK